MIEADTVMRAADVVIRTLHALEEQHFALLRKYNAEEESPQLIEPIRELVTHARESGKNLAKQQDRQQVQRIIDFWLANLYQFGERPIKAALLPYDPSQATLLQEADFPYKLDQAFRDSPAHEPIGWTLLLERCLDKLRQGKRLLAIVGPQRSGRSFLLQSGLLPTLRQGRAGQIAGARWHYFPVFVPSESALAYLNRLLRAPAKAEGFVLPIDNLETLFTNCTEADIDLFAQRLLDWLNESRMHVVLLTMRSDSRTHLRAAPADSPRGRLLRLIEEGEVRIQFDTEELRKIIELPAQRVGLEFQDPRLVDQVLRDVQGDPGALPLLQFTLRQLWRHREGNLITWQSYLKAGSGRSALANVGEECFDSLKSETDKETARKIFVQLVRVKSAREIVCQAPTFGALACSCGGAEQVNRVLEPFESERILVREAQPSLHSLRVTLSSTGWLRGLQRWPLTLGRRLRLWDLAAAAQPEQCTVHLPEGAPGRSWPRRLLSAALWQGLLLGLSRLFGARTEADPEAAQERVYLAQESLLGAWPRLESWVQEERAAVRVRQERRRVLGIATASALAIVALIVWIVLVEAARQREKEAGEGLTKALATEKTATAFLAELAADYVYTDPGLAKLEENDLTVALHYFEAARSARKKFRKADSLDDPDSQLRSNLVWRQLPTLIDWRLFDFEVLSTDVGADGRYLALGTKDGRCLFLDLQEPQEKPPVELGERVKSVDHVCFSPRGQFLMAACTDANNKSFLRVWSLPERKLWLKDIAIAFNQPARPAAVSDLDAHGQTMMVAAVDDSKTQVRIWQGTKADGEFKLLAGDSAVKHEQEVTKIAFHPTLNEKEPQLFTSSNDGRLRGWFLAASKPASADLVHKDVVPFFAVNRNGRNLAYLVSNYRVAVWPLPAAPRPDQDGGLADRLPKYSQPLVSLAVLDDQTSFVFSAGENGEIRAYDYATKAAPIVLPMRHRSRVNDLALSPDKRLFASASRDQTALLWDRRSFTPVASSLRHRGSVEKVWFSATGRYVYTLSSIHPNQADTLKGEASSNHERTIQKELRKWDLYPLVANPPPIFHRSAVTTAVASADGRFVASGSADGGVFLWDSTRRQTLALTPLAKDDVPKQAVLALRFSASGDRLALLTAGPSPLVVWDTKRVWDEAPPPPRIAPPPPRIAPLAKPVTLAIDPDGAKLALGCDGGVIHIYDYATNQWAKPLLEEPTYRTTVSALVWSPDGARLASACDRKDSKDKKGPARVSLWDVHAGTLLKKHEKHTETVSCLAFHRDGKLLASGGKDDRVIVWRLADDTFPIRGEFHRADVVSVQFDPTRQVLLSTSVDGRALRWHLDTPDSVVELKGHRSEVTSSAFSRNGQWLATTSKDSTVRIWKADSGALLGIWKCPQAVYAAAFRDDTELIAAGYPPPIVEKGYRPATGHACSLSRIVLRETPLSAAAIEALDSSRAEIPLLDLGQEQREQPWKAEEKPDFPLNAVYLRPLSNRQMQQAWRAYQAELGKERPPDDPGWHDQAALDAEVASHWSAMLFHLQERAGPQLDREFVKRGLRAAIAYLRQEQANEQMVADYVRQVLRKAPPELPDWVKTLTTEFSPSPDDIVRFLNRMGRVFANRRDGASLVRLLEVSPKPLDTQLVRLGASLSAGEGKWTQAAHHCREVAIRAGTDQSLQYAWALAALRAGGFNEELRKVLDPRAGRDKEALPEVVNARAWSLLLAVNPPEAIADLPALLEARLLKAGSPPPAFLNTYALALIRAGKPKDAIPYLEQAARQTGKLTQAPVREHLLLALAHASAGQHPDAGEHLRKADKLREDLAPLDPFEPTTFWTGIEWDWLRGQVGVAMKKTPGG